MPGHVAHGQRDATVVEGRRVVPVAAHPARLLSGQVPDRHPQSGQVDRGGWDGQHDLLELRRHLVFGGEAALVLAQLALHLRQPGTAGLPRGDVLRDAVQA